MTCGKVTYSHVMKLGERLLDKLFPSRADWRTAAQTFARASELLEETRKIAGRILEELEKPW